MKLFSRVFYAFGFFFFYLMKLVQSNLVIAKDILSLNLNIKPGFIRVPVMLKTDTGLLLFSNLVSMTPGTLTTDISADKAFFEIHVLYLHAGSEKMEKEMMHMQKKIEKFIQ